MYMEDSGVILLERNMALTNESEKQHAILDLVPFNNDCENGVHVRCSVSLSSGSLDLKYDLSGNLSDLILPPHTGRQIRKDGLWEETCFECFFRLNEGQEYWEVNLSPSGGWNVYSFSDYRENRREEKRVGILSLECSRDMSAFSLCCALPLYKLIENPGRINIGLSSILLCSQNGRMFYALSHPASKPDFHEKSGWSLWFVS